MARFDTDKTIKAATLAKAGAKFAEHLEKIGYKWAADEVREATENGYTSCTNASEGGCGKDLFHTSFPESTDWSYFWGIESDGDRFFYAWFIDRDYREA